MRLLDIVPVPLSFVTFIFVCLQLLAAITTSKIATIIMRTMTPPAAPAAAYIIVKFKPFEGALVAPSDVVRPVSVDESLDDGEVSTLEGVDAVVTCFVVKLFVLWGASEVVSTAESVTT